MLFLGTQSTMRYNHVSYCYNTSLMWSAQRKLTVNTKKPMHALGRTVSLSNETHIVPHRNTRLLAYIMSIDLTCAVRTAVTIRS